MQFLTSLRASDVDPHASDGPTASYRTRIAGRAIIFDGRKVALIKVGKHGYYMLPGGGIDDDNIADGLRREVREELGCDIKLGQKVGVTEVFIDRWENRQIDHCFIAYATHPDIERDLTSFEKEEDHHAIWAKDLDYAIQLIKQAEPVVLDGKLVKARDLFLLETARRLLAKE